MTRCPSGIDHKTDLITRPVSKVRQLLGYKTRVQSQAASRVQDPCPKSGSFSGTRPVSKVRQLLGYKTRVQSQAASRVQDPCPKSGSFSGTRPVSKVRQLLGIELSLWFDVIQWPRPWPALLPVMVELKLVLFFTLHYIICHLADAFI